MSLRRWFRREARRVARRGRLEDALLGGRFAAYALYRLRFFAVRSTLSAALHAAKILIAFRIFLPGNFAVILIVEAVAALVGGFWWGSLETMRERVRELLAAGRAKALAAEIGAWMSWSLRGALLALAAGSLGAAARLLIRGARFGPADLFLLAVIVRLGLELVTRCYHSGIFAVRRVYRPLAAIVLVEILSFGAGLALWPVVGTWALPIASLLSTTVAAALLVHFARRAYRHFNLSPRPSIRLRRTERPRGAGRRDWLAAGSAFALMRIDAVVLLAVVAASGAKGSPLSAMIAALGPLIRAAFEWTQLFYFDLKKLDAVLLSRLRAAFASRLLIIAGPVAVAAGLAAWGVAAFVFGNRAGRIIAPLFVFFVARSLLAALQMNAFTMRAYGLLIGSGIFIAAGWLSVGRIAGDPVIVLAAGAGVLVAAMPVLAKGAFGERSPARSAGRLLSLPDWIKAVRRVRERGSISAALFAPGSSHRGQSEPSRWAETDRWAHRRVADAAARALGRNGFAALAGPARIVWFEKSGAGRTRGREWFLTRGAGLIQQFPTTDPRKDGNEALAAAAALGILGWAAKARGTSSAPSAASVREEFAALAPEGIIFSPGETAPPGLKSLAKDERSAVYADALAFASEFRVPRPASRFDVTSFVEDGRIRLVFILGRRTPSSIRARWRSTVRRRNFEAALLRGLSTGHGE